MVSHLCQTPAAFSKRSNQYQEEAEGRKRAARANFYAEKHLEASQSWDIVTGCQL